MDCLDEDIALKGSVEGGKFWNTIKIVFDACVNQTESNGEPKPGTPVCKSHQVIQDWLLDKNIMVIMNEHKFHPNDYQDPI